MKWTLHKIAIDLLGEGEGVKLDSEAFSSGYKSKGTPHIDQDRVAKEFGGSIPEDFPKMLRDMRKKLKRMPNTEDILKHIADNPHLKKSKSRKSNSASNDFNDWFKDFNQRTRDWNTEYEQKKKSRKEAWAESDRKWRENRRQREQARAERQKRWDDIFSSFKDTPEPELKPRASTDTVSKVVEHIGKHPITYIAAGALGAAGLSYGTHKLLQYIKSRNKKKGHKHG